MTFTEFQNLLNEVWVQVKADNVGSPQCVDVAQLWARALGYPRFTGNASDIFNQAGTNYTQIANTPDNSPQQGDIVVWSTDYNGTVGHVGIATGNNTDSSKFECFEQNDPLSSEVHLNTYSYIDVLGWLRPNQLPQDQQATIDELRKARDDNWNLYQVDETTIKNLNVHISALESQVSTLTTQATAYQNQVTTLQVEADKVQPLTWQLAHSESDRTACLQAEDGQQAKIKELQAEIDNGKPKTFIDKLKFLFSLFSRG